MDKKSTLVVEQIPFRGLSLLKVAEVDIELVDSGRTVMVFMRRINSDPDVPDQIVRVWISSPDPRDMIDSKDISRWPLRVTVEGE